MYAYFFRPIAVTAVLSLAACGGGGSSGSGGNTNPGSGNTAGSGKPKPAISYNSLLNDLESFNERNAFKPYTPERNIPVSNKATYSGVGGYRPNSTPDNAQDPLYGKATLVADFDKGTVSGKVTDFRAAPGNKTTGGSMKLESTIMGNEVHGTLSGNVNLNNKQHQFSERAFGGFHGPNGESVGAASIGVNRAGEGYIALIAGTKGK